LAALVGCTAACQPGPAGISPSGTPTATRTGGWRSLDLPTLPPPKGNLGQDDALTAVASISPTDVWAVGYRNSPDEIPLALHWDGTRWSVFQPLSPAGQNLGSAGYPSSLIAVSASGPNDVWAAGDPGQPYLVHWTAGAWTVVPVPSAAPYNRPGRLDDVAAVSPADAWFVGGTPGAAGSPITERWDGARWSAVPTPAVPTTLNGSRLRHLAVVSSRDVWAMGDRDGLADTDRGCLLEHWDGNRWSLVDCPAPAGAASASLNAAAVLSPTDIWAVGQWEPHQVGTELVKLRALVEHWDGVAWHVMPAPDLLYPLESVAARSDTDIVAATPYQPGGVLRWDGTQWQTAVLATAVPAGLQPWISGLAVATDGRIWAVGQATSLPPTSGAPTQERTSQPLILVNDP
jgi:hypothetical protein